MNDFKQIFDERAKLKRLIDKYNEIKTVMYTPPRSYIGQVRGHPNTGSRTERLYEKAEEIYSDILRQVLKMSKMKRGYMDQIEQLPSPEQQDVMFQRYVLERKFTEIAEDRETGVRRVFQLHGDALKKLQDQEEKNDCDEK